MENQENKVRVENLTKYFGDLHVLDGEDGIRDKAT